LPFLSSSQFLLTGRPISIGLFFAEDAASPKLGSQKKRSGA